MADQTTVVQPPDHITVNGKDYIATSQVPASPPLPFWEENGDVLGVLGIVGVTLVLLAMVACFWWWMCNHARGNWRCALFGHRTRKDRLNESDYTNVANSEIIYCKRCLTKLDTESKR